MILKLLLLIAVIYAVYLFFFKKSLPKSSKKSDHDEAQTMVECSECHTYIDSSEALISNGKYYCSKACLDS